MVEQALPERRTYAALFKQPPKPPDKPVDPPLGVRFPHGLLVRAPASLNIADVYDALVKRHPDLTDRFSVTRENGHPVIACDAVASYTAVKEAGALTVKKVACTLDVLHNIATAEGFVELTATDFVPFPKYRKALEERLGEYGTVMRSQTYMRPEPKLGPRVVYLLCLKGTSLPPRTIQLKGDDYDFRVNTFVERNTQFCSFCRQVGHWRRECPNAPACRHCGDTGHSPAACPALRKQKSTVPGLPAAPAAPRRAAPSAGASGTTTTQPARGANTTTNARASGSGISARSGSSNNTGAVDDAPTVPTEGNTSTNNRGDASTLTTLTHQGEANNNATDPEHAIATATDAAECALAPANGSGDGQDDNDAGEALASAAPAAPVLPASEPERVRTATPEPGRQEGAPSTGAAEQSESESTPSQGRAVRPSSPSASEIPPTPSLPESGETEREVSPVDDREPPTDDEAEMAAWQREEAAHPFLPLAPPTPGDETPRPRRTNANYGASTPSRTLRGSRSHDQLAGTGPSGAAAASTSALSLPQRAQQAARAETQ